MEDNKLTEFEEKETIEPSEFEVNLISLIAEMTGFRRWWWDTDFLADLRQIMPPTCTPNERKFLDEIKEKGRKSILDRIFFIGDEGLLDQSEFDSNLSELMEKKE